MDILNNLGFDWRVALANLVNFLIIFFILKKFAFQPIQRVLDERRAKIDSGLEKAKQAEAKLLMAEETAGQELDKARAEVNKIVTEARLKEKIILSEAESKAVAVSESLAKSSRAALEKERAQAEAELKTKTVDLIIDGLQKILPSEIDDKKREELVKNLTHHQV